MKVYARKVYLANKITVVEVEMVNAIIIYETRKGVTKLIAEAIQEGMEQSGVEVLLKRISEVDLVELADYGGVILGSPTYHKDMVQTMKTFLFKLEQSNLKGKVGASFGAYGWSGEAVEMISETMKHIFAWMCWNQKISWWARPTNSVRHNTEISAEKLPKK
jgi:flavodoxin I